MVERWSRDKELNVGVELGERGVSQLTKGPAAVPLQPVWIEGFCGGFELRDFVEEKAQQQGYWCYFTVVYLSEFINSSIGVMLFHCCLFITKKVTQYYNRSKTKWVAIYTYFNKTRLAHALGVPWPLVCLFVCLSAEILMFLFSFNSCCEDLRARVHTFGCLFSPLMLRTGWLGHVPEN